LSKKSQVIDNVLNVMATVKRSKL